MADRISRRTFLTGTAAGAALLAAGCDPLGQAGGSATGGPGTTSPTSTPSTSPTGGGGRATGDRLLVVVQLGGGNDGLNTLVPVNDATYRKLRPKLALATGSVVSLAGQTEVGLHPALKPLAAQWNARKLAAVRAVAVPGQSRSHFEAMEAWWSGDPTGAVRTGWLGRWLDETDPGDGDPLRAIAIGGGSPILRADRALSTSVTSLDGFRIEPPAGTTADAAEAAWLAMAAPLSTDPALAAAQSAMQRAAVAADRLAAAAPGGDGGTGLPDDAGVLTAGLDSAARIFEQGGSTRAVVVAGGGFDTHSGQLYDHERLLADLAAGVTGFLGRMQAAGLSDRVLVVTTSEFGRRVQENGSAGTDHGQGGLVLLAGGGVADRRIVGDADLTKLVDGDLPAEIDVRGVYAAALDWLGGPTDEILGATYDRYGLVRA